MKQITKIEKCPFCKTKGQEAIIYTEFDKQEDLFYAHVECPYCCCQGPLASNKDEEIAKNEARSLWNNRK